jgi:hypothetical protein
LLIVAAISFVLAFWLPNIKTNADTWVLIDESQSCGGSISEQDLGLIPQQLLQRALLANKLRSFPSPWLKSSDLGTALNKISREASNGDKLLVLSDGRSLSAINDTFDDLHISHIPAPGPQIRHVAAPQFYDGKSSLSVNIYLAQDVVVTDDLSLAVESEKPLFAPSEFVSLRPDLVQLRLYPAPSASSFEFKLLVNSQLHSTHAVLNQSLPAITKLTPPFEAAEVRRLLNSGISCVIEYPKLTSLSQVPQQWRMFKPKSDKSTIVYCLLDMSGSMDGNGLADAVSALHEIAQQHLGVELHVYPFNSTLHKRLTPLDELSSLSPFGPTNLSLSLEQLSTQAPGLERLIVLSDGNATPPQQGWQQFIAAKFAAATVMVVACSDNAQTQSLSELGLVIDDTNLIARLQSALDHVSPKVVGKLSAATNSFYTIPDALSSNPDGIPIFGVEAGHTLYQNQDADPALLLSQYGEANLFSIAGAVNHDQLQQIAFIDNSIREQRPWKLDGNQLQIYSSTPPVLTQNNRPIATRLVDASDDQLLFESQIDPTIPVFYQADTGQPALKINPNCDVEFSADYGPFFELISYHQARHSEFNIFYYFLALSLFLVALFVYHHKYD